MVTELFLAWSEADPLAAEVPRATAGTAGVTACLPFTGRADEAALAFCAEEADAAPTTTGGWEPGATMGAVAAGFLGAPAAEA